MTSWLLARAGVFPKAELAPAIVSIQTKPKGGASAAPAKDAT